jgi:hypothetical protein
MKMKILIKKISLLQLYIYYVSLYPKSITPDRIPSGSLSEFVGFRRNLDWNSISGFLVPEMSIAAEKLPA